MNGTTGTPNMSRVISSIGPMTSGSRAVTGGAGSLAEILAIVIAVSVTTRASVACTDSTVWPGTTRQLTVAVAAWGSALLAWPPASRVAVQVVRRTAFIRGEAES